MTEVSTRPLRVIGYCRVSTAKQSDNGHGLGAQHAALEHFCTQHGHELLTVTTDVVSGVSSDRMYGREVAIAASRTLRPSKRVLAAAISHRRATPGYCAEIIGLRSSKLASQPLAAFQRSCAWGTTITEAVGMLRGPRGPE
jgi:Resolvase, N terminal domain